MNIKKMKWTTAGALASVAFCANAAAQSSDALLDKLVQKGILTAQEAKDLREDAKKDFDKNYRKETSMPEWVTGLKFNGDFRARYDGVYQDTDPVTAGADRTRLRYRVRFGATASLTDHFEVGLRLGSGEVGSALPSFGGSAFSANTTLNNDASRKFIFVDLAYAKWTPCNEFQAEVGKMNGPFWFTDMVLDPDYNPEGGQEKIAYALNDNHKVSLTSGQYVIAENFRALGTGSNNDTYLFVNQIDWTAKWTPKISSRLALAAYNFKNQNDISFGATGIEGLINQNGTPAAGPGAVNFNPIIARAELTCSLNSFPLFTGQFPITLGGEYANNTAASSLPTGNQAYNVGATFGSARQKNNWAISYNYKNIGTAAVWRGLNDDDFGFAARGGTDVRGHQIVASYHAYNPLFINLRYMKTEQINNAPGTFNEQDRLFFDLLWTF